MIQILAHFTLRNEQQVSSETVASKKLIVKVDELLGNKKRCSAEAQDRTENAMDNVER